MLIPTYLEELRSILPRDKEHATSIAALATQLNRDEREIRDMVKALREDCLVPVIALPTPNGVWLSSDPKELDAQIACQVSRARSIERSIERLKRVRDRMTYHPALF